MKNPKPGDLVYDEIGWGDHVELEVIHVYEDNTILVHEPGFPGNFIKSYLSCNKSIDHNDDKKVRRISSWEIWNPKKQEFEYVKLS